MKTPTLKELINIPNNQKSLELNDADLAELARLITKGFTGGRLDGEDNNGNAVYITWELKTEKWQD